MKCFLQQLCSDLMDILLPMWMATKVCMLFILYSVHQFDILKFAFKSWCKSIEHWMHRTECVPSHLISLMPKIMPLNGKKCVIEKRELPIRPRNDRSIGTSFLLLNLWWHFWCIVQEIVRISFLIPKWMSSQYSLIRLMNSHAFSTLWRWARHTIIGWPKLWRGI